MSEQPATTVDASGLQCPLPILKAKKALAVLEPGQLLEVITTDRNATKDFQAFCRQTGNPLVSQVPDGEKVRHRLRRRL